jgi:hypothetical protein
LFVCVGEAYQVEFGKGGAEEGEAEWEVRGWVREVLAVLFDWSGVRKETEGD